MLSSDSPFPRQWVGTGLEEVGLEDVRPDDGTYGEYDYGRLPPLPFEMKGDLQWLAAMPAHDRHSIAFGSEDSPATAEPLAKLRRASLELGVPLPEAFVKFMETPSLHSRVRSNTDCFLDLCPAPVRSPGGDGYLIRFLADSQGCRFWYVYVSKESGDHAVVCSPEYYGTPDEESPGEEPNPSQPHIVFTAESFESFLCRFWLENEIWFTHAEGKPMPDVGRRYIEQYRGQR